MLLGYARGKLGDTIYSRGRGQQLTRGYRAIVQPSNVLAQQATKVSFRNGQNFYIANSHTLRRFWHTRTVHGTVYSTMLSRFKRDALMVSRFYANEGFYTPQLNYFPPSSMRLPYVPSLDTLSGTPSTYRQTLFFTGLQMPTGYAPDTVGELTEWVRNQLPWLKDGMAMFCEFWYNYDPRDVLFVDDEMTNLSTLYGSRPWSHRTIEIEFKTGSTQELSLLYPELEFVVYSRPYADNVLALKLLDAQPISQGDGALLPVVCNFGIVMGDEIVSSIVSYTSSVARAIYDCVRVYQYTSSGKTFPALRTNYGKSVRSSYDFPISEE